MTGEPVGSDLLFVNGTLMRGLKLHANLDGAEFVEEARTAPHVSDPLDRGRPSRDVPRAARAASRCPARSTGCPTRSGDGSRPGSRRVCTAARSASTMVGSCPGSCIPRELAQAHPDISEYGGWRAYWESRTTSSGADR